jgi:hypothetical protein
MVQSRGASATTTMTDADAPDSRMPSISARRGIAYGYSAPYENTDTIVLTAPSGRFVDLRFPLANSHASQAPESVSSDARPPALWLFSGISTSTVPQAGDFPAWPHAKHCVWMHEIDSKGRGIEDEGDMFDLPNGDAMEVGFANGQLYKEYWTDSEDVLFPCVVAEIVAHEASEKVSSAEERGRGRLVRVGNLCQGIVETMDDAGALDGCVRAERWKHSTAADGQQGWLRTKLWDDHNDKSSHNDHSSVYDWLLDGNEKKAGVEYTENVEASRSHTWRVVESLSSPRP